MFEKINALLNAPGAVMDAESLRLLLFPKDTQASKLFETLFGSPAYLQPITLKDQRPQEHPDPGYFANYE